MTTTPPQALIKPSDAKAWSSCIRRVWLDNKADLDLQTKEDAFEQLIIELGIAHEQTVFERLSGERVIHTATSPDSTSHLMAQGVPVIYQAQLQDLAQGIIGRPDFLILHESGQYQAADAKLSLSETKKEIQVQLGTYRHLLGNDLPAIVYLGDGSQELIGDECKPVTNQFLTQMRQLLSREEAPDVRYSHSKCQACPYHAHCRPQFEARGELSLLYGVDGRSAQPLEDAGFITITQLANADPKGVPDVPFLKGEKKKQRAILQAKAYLTGESFQTSPIELPQGHWIHFDIEDNPLTSTGNKHVYLWGFLTPGYERENFEFVWTDSPDEDEHGWHQFLDQVRHYRQQYPDLILAHYSSHERSTIKAYAERFNMQDDEIVTYLLGENSPLFDLRRPVLDSLVLPLQGYGLKDICKHPKLVNFQWQDEGSGSQWSVVQFNRFLNETNKKQRQN